jgi:hypothetical protein
MSYSAKSGQIVPAGATNLSVIVRLMEPVSGTVGLGSVTITSWPAVWLHVPGLASGTISLSNLASATADFAAGGVYFLGGNEFRLDFTCNGAAGALVLAAKNASYELEVVKTMQVGDSASNMFGVTTIVDNGTAVRNVNLTQALGQAVTLDANNVLKVSLAAAQPLYPPAKAGDAMTLTPGERTATANEVENQIIDDTDSEKVLQAITDKIAAVNPSLAGLTIGAIATGVWANVTRSLTDKAGFAPAAATNAIAVRTELAAELAQLDAPVSDAVNEARSAATAVGIVGQAVGNVQTGVDGLPDAIAARQIEDHGEGSYVNVAGGDGEFPVNHNSSGTDALQAVRGSTPLAGVTIRAYVATAYDADSFTPVARATTGTDGRWIAPMMLDADDYVLTFDETGYDLSVVRITVADDGTVTLAT